MYIYIYIYIFIYIYIYIIRSVTIAGGGVLPNIHSVLLPKEILPPNGAPAAKPKAEKDAKIADEQSAA